MLQLMGSTCATCATCVRCARHYPEPQDSYISYQSATNQLSDGHSWMNTLSMKFRCFFHWHLCWCCPVSDQSANGTILVPHYVYRTITFLWCHGFTLAPYFSRHMFCNLITAMLATNQLSDGHSWIKTSFTRYCCLFFLLAALLTIFL